MSSGKGDTFINPYNFVPFGERPEGADHAPAGHGSYGEDRISGTIACVMTAKTPLLILDQDYVDPDGRQDVRIGPDGKPLILPSSIRGMLRGAYEAVTSSRLGVPIRGPFTIREDAKRSSKDGPKYPAIVHTAGDIQGVWVNIMEIEDRAGILSPATIRTRIEDLKKWNVPLSEWEQKDWWVLVSRESGRGSRWIADRVAASRDELGEGPNHTQFIARGRLLVNPNPAVGGKRRHHILVPVEITAGEGFELKVTRLLADDAMKAAWRDQVDRLKQSRPEDAKRWALREGRTLLVRLETENDQRRIVDVSIAEIGRQLTAVTPDQLLPEDMAAPKSWEEFSPADRLFGMASESGDLGISYRSSIRVGPVQALAEGTETQVRTLPPLEAPKPQQYGFYVRSTRELSARRSWADGPAPMPKSTGDDSTLTRAELRGFKVYPHHIRRAELRDGGNAESALKIRRWVPDGTEFRFTIHVQGAEREDLLPLLSLLSLPADEFHRLGRGKPLGLGSLHIEIDWANSKLGTGAHLREEYRSGSRAERDETDGTNELQEMSRSSSDEIPWQAWRAAAKGFANELISYPPAQSPGPDAGEGKHFEWFVRNSKLPTPNALPELATPDVDPPTLPAILPDPRSGSPKRQKGRQGGGPGSERGKAGPRDRRNGAR